MAGVVSHRGRQAKLWEVGLDRAADLQGCSLLFSKLPIELRQLIYVEFWRLSGLRQHIWRHPFECRIAHRPCDAPEGTWERGLASGSNRRPVMRDGVRIIDGYGEPHWRCDETNFVWERCQVFANQWEGCYRWQSELVEKTPAVWSPYLPVFLTCKRIYHEAYPALFQSTTFIMLDYGLARLFLSSLSPNTPCNLELDIKIGRGLLRGYAPAEEEGISAALQALHEPRPPRIQFHTADRDWDGLCAVLRDMVALRRLHIVMSMPSKDGEWTNIVPEIELLAGLWGVKASNQFTLALPALQRDRKMWGFQGHYLEGDKLAGAPFELWRLLSPWQKKKDSIDDPYEEIL